MIHRALMLLLVITLQRGLLFAADAPSEGLVAARRLALRGNYAEAITAFQQLADKEPNAAALGISRCQAAQGDGLAAEQTLSKGIDAAAEKALLQGELACHLLERGDLEQAEHLVEVTLKEHPRTVSALWVQAELARLRGDYDTALKRYRALVRLAHDYEIADPDSLRLIGRAAAQSARWSRTSEQFRFLVNEFWPQCYEAEPDYWPAHLEAAELFLEKYNQPEAAREILAGLKINPYAAELHVAQGMISLENYEFEQGLESARRALELNPRLLAAHYLKADLELACGDWDAALRTIEAALPLNLQAEPTLARLAALRLLHQTEPSEAEGTPAGRIIAEVRSHNPHPGEFFLILAETLDRAYRFPLAASYFARAQQEMPQLTTVAGKLGFAQMRLGQESEAQQTLNESFRIDPFNVRVSNTLKVLELLGEYRNLETEHFRIRYAAADELLAQEMARWMEQIYPELCESLGYHPPDKTLLEIFSPAKGATAHNWFSIRMAGLPNIHTVGACVGKLVAMQSPSEGSQRFDWATVLKHEFIHVLNLQQTDFSVPRWFTEGLATHLEDQPRPVKWDVILDARRRRKRLLNLEVIDRSFIHPQSSDEWSLAYCQSELYIEYLKARFGPEVIPRLLAAFARRQQAADAIQQVCHQSVAEFEAGYQKYVNELVLRVDESAGALSLADAKEKLLKQRTDPALWAALAKAELQHKDLKAARKAAEESLKLDAHQPAANWVLAKIAQQEGDAPQAIRLLETNLDRNHPHLESVAALAALYQRAGKLDQAILWYQVGAEAEPHEARWAKSVIALAQQKQDDALTLQFLVRLAALDPTNLAVHKRVAAAALAKQDWALALRSATAGLHLIAGDDVLQAQRAQACEHLDQLPLALTSWEAACSLQPEKMAYRCGLARTLLALGERDKARSLIADILKRSPDLEEARQLQQRLSSETDPAQPQESP